MLKNRVYSQDIGLMPVFSPILSLFLLLYPTYAVHSQELPIQESPTNVSPQGVISGMQISVNGYTSYGAWLQKPAASDQMTTLVSDGSFKRLFGVDLLDSSNPELQPVQWFSSREMPMVTHARLLSNYRYLDITQLAKQFGWQIQANHTTLIISTPHTKVTDIAWEDQVKRQRLVVNLDSPTPWRAVKGLPIEVPSHPINPITPNLKSAPKPNVEWIIHLDGIVSPPLLSRYNISTQVNPTPYPSQPEIAKVEVLNNQTSIHLSIPAGLFPQVSSVDHPHRLIIDIRPDALVARDITWTTGLRWRQHYLNLGSNRFAVIWLELDPHELNLRLAPIWANPQTLVGTAPLIEFAQHSSALGAINGGYFNRTKQLPLGAIRLDNQWASGPILNRGAIAWNNSQDFYFDRLTLTETLIVDVLDREERLPILFLNSGFVQSGISRYTPIWGRTYTPLTDNETIVVVQNNQVTQQISGGKVNNPIAIPTDGYLLVFRGESTKVASGLSLGEAVQIASTTTPTEFTHYAQIIGAGPLLIKNSQVVLDAQCEHFSPAFIAEKAIRSSICTTATGTLILATVNHRVGGPGPTLAEQAQIMLGMGCVNALNLDGGSSTSLYLGGELINRSPSTAGRVHNGIGIFLEAK
jgi:hypothetical protein